MICKLQFQEEKASCPEWDLDRFADMPATSDFLFHMRALIWSFELHRMASHLSICTHSFKLNFAYVAIGLSHIHT
jgi:hypothetical protein